MLKNNIKFKIFYHFLFRGCSDPACSDRSKRLTSRAPSGIPTCRDLNIATSRLRPAIMSAKARMQAACTQRLRVSQRECRVSRSRGSAFPPAGAGGCRARDRIERRVMCRGHAGLSSVQNSQDGFSKRIACISDSEPAGLREIGGS